MCGIGKSSAWLAVALVFGCAALMLPTEASAQFPNIDGLIRGAMQHGNGGYYRAPSHHTKSHSDDSSNNTPAKEKDATQDESQSANGGSTHQQQQSSGPQNMGRQTSDAQPKSSGPSKVTDDQPSFAPSR